MNFPEVHGSNLLRQKMTLPAALDTELSVLLVAFEQWQQLDINTWMPFLEQLELEKKGLRYFELPVIKRMNPFARTFINEGMRAGIPNQKARERTITLYLDKREFRQSLGITHENDICILLVDRQGAVLWQTQGSFSPAKGEALERAVKESGVPDTVR